MSVDTVLVTGAFGQIGKRCIEILLDRGRAVVAADLANDATRAVAEQYCAQVLPAAAVAVIAASATAHADCGDPGQGPCTNAR